MHASDMPGAGDMSTARVFNFGAGPAVLPEPALEEAQRDLRALPAVGMSVLEISHRSQTFGEIIETTAASIRTWPASQTATTSCSCRGAAPSSSRWFR